MRKETYETPLFESIRVEMEEGFMKASLGDSKEDTQEGLSIQDQEGSVAIGDGGEGFDNNWGGWDN